MNLPISAFCAAPKVGYSTDFRCIECWSEEVQYAGARFSDFIKFYDLGKKADGSYYNYAGLETPDKKYFFSDTRPPDYWANKGHDWYAGF